METSDKIALAALVLSALVAAGSLIGFITNRRDAQASSRDAAQASERAQAAVEEARRAADAQERIAEHFSDMLSRAEKRDQRQWSSAVPTLARAGQPYMSGGGGTMPGPRPAVHWTVDRLENKRYQLKNLGTGDARNVRLSADNAVRFNAEGESIDIGSHGGTTTFRALGSWQTGTPELVVIWDDDDGDDHEWRRVLP